MIGLKTHRWNHIFGEDGKALIADRRSKFMDLGAKGLAA